MKKLRIDAKNKSKVKCPYCHKKLRGTVDINIPIGEKPFWIITFKKPKHKGRGYDRRRVRV